MLITFLPYGSVTKPPTAYGVFGSQVSVYPKGEGHLNTEAGG
jgi:hypothetical protein